MSSAAQLKTNELRLDTLADSVLLLALMSIVQRLIGFARSFLVCRWLDPHQLGVWEMALGFIGLASPVIVLGLPGSFVRYTEHFGRQGQLRAFVRRTLCASAACAAIGLAVLSLAAGEFSRLVFGVYDPALLRLVVIALAAVTAFNVLGQLLLSLRLYRYQSLLEFVQTVLFAGLCLWLLAGWRTGAVSVVLAYGASMALVSALGLKWTGKAWRSLSPCASQLPYSTWWRKLLPFAFWVWISNWLANMFQTVDRYMVLHLAGLDATDALELLGQYHSASVIPMVLVGFANVLGGIITPHLSHDWEEGRRDAVRARMNLAIKLLGVTLTAGAAFVLSVAPWLFETGFQGKYAFGLAVLPLALSYCCWLGMSYLSASYLWCVEKAKLSSVALFIGLTANVALNFLLLPPLGLTGAVLATSAANLLTLLAIYGFNRWQGLKVDAGVWAATALPALFWFGPWVTVTGLVAVVCAAALGGSLLNETEKESLKKVVGDYLARLRRRKS